MKEIDKGSHIRSTIEVRVYNHGPALELPMNCRWKFGYRVYRRDGTLVVAMPGKDCAHFASVELPADWSLKLSSGHAYTSGMAFRLVDPGEYIIEAGIVSYESEFPWARISYTVD